MDEVQIEQKERGGCEWHGWSSEDKRQMEEKEKDEEEESMRREKQQRLVINLGDVHSFLPSCRPEIDGEALLRGGPTAGLQPSR